MGFTSSPPWPWPPAALDIQVKGLLGGHSGMNIHEDRGEARAGGWRVLGSSAEDWGSAEAASVWQVSGGMWVGIARRRCAVSCGARCV